MSGNPTPHEIPSVSLARIESEPSSIRHDPPVPQLGQGMARIVKRRRRDIHGQHPTGFPPNGVPYDPSAQSLPQPIRRVEIDLTSSNGHAQHESAVSSVGSLQNVRQAFHRIAHSNPFPSRQNSAETNNNSPTRNPTPLRLFWPLHRTHTRDEPFVPIDPFRFRFKLFSQDALEEELQKKRAALTQVPALLRHVGLQAYRHLLLRLPSLYFTRVSRIFEEAEVTRPEIQRMIDGCVYGLDFPYEWTAPNVSPALIRFKSSWEEFVDTVIQEWKTLNVVSALLLSAILTMFQIDDANNDPIVRTASLISLICAAWSLIYGGVYIMRFRTMRSMYKASTWAQEGQKSKTNIFWNVWVLLALPAVWLAWSMIAFFVAILAFVWTSGSSTDNPQPPRPRVELVPRLIITALFALGFVYFLLIVQAFQSYGAPRTRVYRTDEVPPVLSANANANTNTLGLNFAGANGNAQSGGVSDSIRRADLEKGPSLVEDRRRAERESPGIGGLDL
ncbi:hypothetical protein DFH11DRAFT_1725871 [Phellopilus nigrolimitatus]|nr:hypothetical protein DFH11DRAFT_1725871 [Phellopilus nigrolimitatus]